MRNAHLLDLVINFLVSSRVDNKGNKIFEKLVVKILNSVSKGVLYLKTGVAILLMRYDLENCFIPILMRHDSIYDEMSMFSLSHSILLKSVWA